MDKTLQFSDIPSNWAICYQADCPLAANCLRYRAFTLAPADLNHHECVLPSARRADECRCFVEDRPMRLAYGMRRLLAGVGYEQGIDLRSRLYDLFGSRSQFYRYNERNWPVTPSQQTAVAALFREAGLDREPEFDHYTTGYYFDSNA